MKRTIFFLSLLLGTSPLPHAQEIDGVTVGNLKMDRNGEYLVVEMDVELSRLEVEANRAVLLTPRLVNGADSADLPAVGIYGRVADSGIPAAAEARDRMERIRKEHWVLF